MNNSEKTNMAEQSAKLWSNSLPYIQKLKEKTVLVKFGGNAIINDELLISVLKDISLLKNIGAKPVLVHGGGPFISRHLEALGLETEFYRGLRKTPADVMEVVREVLVGQVNSLIVDYANTRADCKAVGLHGGDDRLIEARKYSFEDGTELGFVGEVAKVNTEIIEKMLDCSYFPVIAPVGIDEKGQCYNINSDIAAGELARALKAEKFIVMTDVDGVREDPDDENSILNSLTPAAAEIMIEQDKICEGMIPKIKSCIKAQRGGVNYTYILNGTKKHILLQELLSEESIGTLIKSED
ncbi:acetylglutamate kinase [Halarsenatibacter silvermanii]|uniref:Acetylglutamate kinase n=1 Tax=Halarsenatibacter silvermanii TaxID=321763 RepID=A0A1G9J531_9FIRM|nr:acetylglutamate kinase [Halarsenatibacter silvermanii]SDL32441.1 N-acetylglutamate kinase [Halarsenatibacter silvermanii]